MVTDCTKCIHEQVCDQASRLMWSAMANEEKCSDFKDRAEYVEVRHGLWRPYKQNVECSVCLVKWAVDESIVLIYTATKDLKYCPNCGAKMKEKDN